MEIIGEVDTSSEGRYVIKYKVTQGTRCRLQYNMARQEMPVVFGDVAQKNLDARVCVYG